MKKEIGAIYFAGLIQGIALVTTPALSTVFTNPSEFHLSNTAYGSLFIPQAIFSIAASAFNPYLCRRFGSKCTFLYGLVANMISMALLALSAAFIKDDHTAYALLLFATSFLGLGFGLIVPTINSMSALLYPFNIDSTLLTLNALLGIGTALAPISINLFVALSFWWGLPACLTGFFSALLVFSLPLKLPGGKIDLISSDDRLFTMSVSGQQEGFPGKFWVFALFALLYGIIETLSGNWVSIYMGKHLHASLKIQSLALTAFWGMVTFGRLFFAATKKIFKEKIAFQIAPFISAIAFVIIASLSPKEQYWAIAAFGLTGFGCSLLLPLIISFGSSQLKSIAASVPGMVISFYLLGYGIAAFGVGPLEEIGHVSLRSIYIIGALIAFILGILSLFVIRKANK